MASCDTALDHPCAEKFFLRLASRIDGDLLAWLFEKRFPLRPFVDFIDPKRIFPGAGAVSPVLRKRWRLLKNLLPCAAEADSALVVTLCDLRPLVNPKSPARRRKSAWKIHARAIAASPADPGRVPPPVKHLYWGGARRRTIVFWDRLVSFQAEELSAIRHLAEQAGRRTGRVVLSWHNATLGAAGGWAFEAPCAMLRAAAADFDPELRREMTRLRGSFDRVAAMELWSMRVDRLFAPEAYRGSDTDKREWPGALSPHQRVSRRQLREWMQSGEKAWAEGLVLLFSLVNLGQRLLDAGKIDSLVLPWIDKFFISSRRRADIGYLDALFRFVSANIESPLVLFWDDTIHAGAPSLALALASMSEGGLPFRGLGIFNAGLSKGRAAERARAASIIRRDYPQKALFALRPINENHCPGAFRQIFEDLDQSFFLNYDSSWKDNLAFLYAGTRVMALLGTQAEMETICPAVVLRGKRWAFGAWFRGVLRRLSLGGDHEPAGGLDGLYCSWANLL